MLYLTITTNLPSINNPNKGFSKWKKLNPKISNHENSNEHLTKVFT